MREIELLMNELNVEQETINKTINKIHHICSQRITTATRTRKMAMMGNGNGNGNGH